MGIAAVRNPTPGAEDSLLGLSASIGVVPLQYDLTLKENLHLADMASRSAKNNGKDQVSYDTCDSHVAV